MSFFRDLEDTLLPEPAAESGNAVDDAYSAFAEEEERQVQQQEAEYRVLSEVEVRLQKANLYRLVLENPLFPAEDGDAAAQVEQEYRTFTLKQLNSLMGVNEAAQIGETLDPEETKILKIWAKKLLNKPAVLGPQPQEVRSQPVLAPVVVKATPPKTPIVSASPAKTPVPQVRTQAQAKPARQRPKPSEVEDQDGIIHKGGKKFMRQPGKDALTGAPKEVLVDVTETVRPVGITPVPYPGQQAALMHEMNVSEMLVPKGNGALGQAFQKVTTRTSSGG